MTTETLFANGSIWRFCGAKLVWDPEMFDITQGATLYQEPFYVTTSICFTLGTPAASPLHLRFCGLEDPPTHDETRHGRPVERVVNTAIGCLTIHCHTRNMPPATVCLFVAAAKVTRSLTSTARRSRGHFIFLYLRLALSFPPPFPFALRRQGLVPFKGRKSANKRWEARSPKPRARRLYMNWIGDDKFAAFEAVIYTRAIVPSVLHPATYDIVSQPPPKSREETEDTEAQKFLPPESFTMLLYFPPTNIGSLSLLTFLKQDRGRGHLSLPR
ncbi:hypothetical protein EDB84DRAFT_1558403 [Lactarius hengduanensis]|nr:hypothetical protein EDB84DRAFT_1558403 [Lactarius hengduanensis]